MIHLEMVFGYVARTRMCVKGSQTASARAKNLGAVLQIVNQYAVLALLVFRIFDPQQ